jgi:hypothetical protein
MHAKADRLEDEHRKVQREIAALRESEENDRDLEAALELEAVMQLKAEVEDSDEEVSDDGVVYDVQQD